MKKLLVLATTIHAVGPTGQGPVIGSYSYHPALGPDQQEPLVVTSVPCPYCHEPLYRRDTERDVRRTVRITGPVVNDAWPAEVAEIPQTHQVLRCKVCAERFVAPRSGLFQAPDAVDPVVRESNS